MSDIAIPFSPDMAHAAILGRKHCTSRNRRYGSVGDVFTLIDHGEELHFRIIAIERRPLWEVAKHLHHPEGFLSSDYFMDAWARLHPRKGWEPDRRVWVHWFARIEEPLDIDLHEIEAVPA